MVDGVYLVDEVDAETMRRVVDDGRRALHIHIYANTPSTQPNTGHREALSHSEQNTPMTRAAAGSRLPPPTLATGTLSPTQRTTEQCMKAAKRPTSEKRTAPFFARVVAPARPD